MNQSNFTDIFTLSVFHTYFDDQKLPNIQFVPAPATQQLMTNSGMRISTTGNGDKAALLTSQNLIPYNESPKHKLDLISKGVETRVVISRLPVAHPGHMAKVNEDGQDIFYTPIYIYV